MRKTLLVLVLTLSLAVPFLNMSANASPSMQTECGACHLIDPNVEVIAEYDGCRFGYGGYHIIVEDHFGYEGGMGWAIFNGPSNIMNDYGNMGNVDLPPGATYTIWGVSHSYIYNGGGADAVAVTPCSCTDQDGDLYAIEGVVCGPIDCNDADPAINPGAVEDCTDGIDNDCDNLVDAADPDAVNCPPTCTDGDGDLYFAGGGTCGPTDCNDNDPAINPGAVEDCTDGIDNDCDNLVDCDDTDCSGAPSCQPLGPEICDDGYDNDGDGKVDCDDKKDCRKDPAC